MENSKYVGETKFGKHNFDEAACEEIEKHKSYIDNFIVFPIAAKYAIRLVSSIWKEFYLHPDIIKKSVPLFLQILFNHLSTEETTYLNHLLSKLTI